MTHVKHITSFKYDEFENILNAYLKEIDEKHTIKDIKYAVSGNQYCALIIYV